MTNTETTTTDKAAHVAAQGAHVAPDKAASKEGVNPNKGAPKGQKAQGCQTQGCRAEEGS